MNEYFCELVKLGVVKKAFYTMAEDEEDLIDKLNQYLWPSGTWRITHIEEQNHEYSFKR